ncbi:hypothetical protein SAMN02745120_1093 [Acetoanaerobium noterae]|uniref:Vitamin B12 dependent methionine synthase, activation domain n=1 Tax=Acetoanaerobium noterae TaxID=745369 RepID=A0A1T5APR0_9FIRM|nr:hypothetical protein [Acetoanaerobium noterae]SKB37024.1 hypothetical protein SAMN02745120_1093 [Acetoanaerobium noterae]
MRINLNLDAKELLKYIDRPYDVAEVSELTSEIKPSLGYKVLPVSIIDGKIELGGHDIKSHYLAKGLENSTEAIFLWATLGKELDDKIHDLLSEDKIYKATLLDELASFAVDFLIEKLYLRLKQDYIKKRKFLTLRYSPGYGDIALDESERIIKLDYACPISYNGSMLVPQKSITAIVGISSTPELRNYPKGIGLCRGENCYACKTWACMKN